MSGGFTISKKEKIESVSVLRIYFITLILLTHFREYIRYDFFAGILFENGLTPIFAQVGVSGFFLISGFILTYNYLPQNELKLPEFIFKRFVRLIPLYYIVILLHVIPMMYISIANVLSHVFLVNVFFPSFSRNPGSIWFVSIIFHFYLIFPFFLKLVKNENGKVLIGIAFSGFFIVQFLMAHAGLYLQDTVFNYLPDFCLGMWIAVKKTHLLKHRLVFLSLFTIFMIVNFGFSMMNFPQNTLIAGIENKSFILSIVLFIFWITYVFTLKMRVPVKILSLGDAVVCVFLFHRLVWMFMLGVWNPDNFLLRFVYLGIFGVPCIFLSSKLLQGSYDKFLVRYGLAELSGLKIFFTKI